MLQYQIRRLRAEDASEFRKVRLEALLNHPEAFGASLEDEQSLPLAIIANRIEQGYVVGGISNKGALAGIAGISTSTSTKTQHIGSIWGMYVRPEARGSGLSRQLLNAIINEFGTTLRSIRLRVASTNEPALRLYKSLGFHEWAVEVEAMQIDGKFHDDILMRLDMPLNEEATGSLRPE